MPENESEKLNRVEEMKSRLFSRNYNTEIKHPNSFSALPEKNVPESWPEDVSADTPSEKFFMKTSTFKKFFIFSIIFFFLAVGYASYMHFVGGNTVSNDNIDISILGNTFTAGGEDLPLVIEITNRNNSSLDLVDLVIEYPKSTSATATEDTERIRESLGTIPAGGVKSENLKVVLFGEQGSVKTVKISLEYRIEGSVSIFHKDKTYDVSINSSPISLTFDTQKEVSSNQEMILNIKAQLNANKVAPNMLLRVDYPAGFEFESATPAPTQSNNIWSLADLAPGAERSIAITGKMIDASNGEEKTFKVWSGTQSSTDKSMIGVVFNSISSVVTINKPSIEAKLFINGAYQREYSSDSKNAIHGEIRWINNMDTKINNLVVSAKITGTALNRKSIIADQGFYNSAQDTIIWDKNGQPDFAEVNPGDSGALTFEFVPAPFSPASGGGAPSINIQVSISGKQSSDGLTFNDLSNQESKVIKIISDVGFANKILHYSGVFKNTGLIPPKVEKETTYTVVWSLSNTSNNLSKVAVTASLPVWVRFVGTVSPKSENVTYNTETKQVVWNAGNLPKGAGITGIDKEVSFQIAFTPSLSQVDSSPVILNDAVLTGRDDFANVNVVVNKAALNTRLSNDPTFPTGGEKVSE